MLQSSHAFGEPFGRQDKTIRAIIRQRILPPLAPSQLSEGDTTCATIDVTLQELCDSQPLMFVGRIDFHYVSTVDQIYMHIRTQRVKPRRR
jgi:hypothetical protein